MTHTYESLKNLRKSQVVKILEDMGVCDISHDGKYSINATVPGFAPGKYDPRDLVLELQNLRTQTPAPAVSAQISIDEQLEIWRKNTPVWDKFPAMGEQSYMYALGLCEDYIDRDLQPRGAILVFNARRGRVAVYPYTARNYARLMGVASFANHAFLFSRDTVHSALGGDTPGGMTIPRHNALIWAKRGIAICNGGIWGYLSSDCYSPYADIELDWFNRVRDSLISCKLTNYIWVDCRVEFCPDLAPVEPSPTNEATPAPADDLAPVEPSPADVGEQSAQTGLPTSHEVRSRFAGLGYHSTAQRAIIEWRGGLMGYHWYVTIPPHGQWGGVEMYYQEDSQTFHMCGGLLPNPNPRDLGEDTNFDQILYAPLEGYTVVSFDDCSPADGLTVAPAPLRNEDFTGFGLGLLPSRFANELGEQLSYWRDQLEIALGGNDWDRIDLCNSWVWAIQGVVSNLIAQNLRDCLDNALR